MIEQNYSEEAIDRSQTPRAARAQNDFHQETMLEFLIEIARRKRLIAKMTGISMAIGLILCFVLPVRYTAVARIMPPKQTPSMAGLLINQMGMGALAQASGASLLTDPNSIFVGLLKSRPIADEIIRMNGLLSSYHAKDMSDARDKLKQYTVIQAEPSTMISISVTDRDKKRAAEIANGYVEQLRILTSSIALTDASRRRAFFAEQLHTQKEALIQAEGAFQQVQQNKGLVHLDAQAGMLINGVAMLRGQIAAKEVELDALRSFSTKNNPQVQVAEDELAGLRGQVSRMEDHNRSSESSDLALKDVPAAGLDYLRAQREVQYQQAFFDILMRQFEAAKLDEAKDAAVIQIVEPAIEPDRKSSPKRMIILLASIFVGLFFGVLSAIVLRRLDLERMDPEGSVALQSLRVALLS